MLFSLKAVDVTSLRKQGFKAFFFLRESLEWHFLEEICDIFHGDLWGGRHRGGATALGPCMCHLLLSFPVLSGQCCSSISGFQTGYDGTLAPGASL